MTLFPVVVAAGLFSIAAGHVIVSEDAGAVIPSHITWPADYHLKGEKLYVTAGLVEPFELWYGGTIQVSRKDVYNGTVKYLNDFRSTCVKIHYVHPETDSDLNVTTKCSTKIVEKKDFDGTAGFLPTPDRFVYKGRDTYQSQNITVWELIGNNEKTGTTEAHELYVTRGDGYDVPVRYSIKSYRKSNGGLRAYIIVNYYDFEPKMERENINLIGVAGGTGVAGVTGLTECSVKFTFNPNLEDDMDLDLETTFHGYKKQHGKNYNNEEHNIRKNIFKKNLKYIMEHNQQENSYKLGVNQFTDMSDEEMAAMSCLLPTREHRELIPKETVKHLETTDIPDELDMRNRGLVTPVKNQLSCGSCWAFATVAAVEVALALRNGGPAVELSEQSLIDCSWSYGNSGCNGGLANLAFTFITAHGIPTDQDYGLYKMEDGICHLNSVPASRRHKIKGLGLVSPTNISAYQDAIVEFGAVAVSIYAGKNLLLYSGGLFYDTECAGKGTNHAVTVVGYGVENGTTYWLVKNSWGPEWGEAGYVRFSAINNNCQLMERGYYVVV